MASAKQVLKTVVEQGILPLYYHSDEDVSIGVLKAVFKAGVRAIEYTNRGEAAYRNFTKLVELRNSEMPDILLGIGTIKNLSSAQDYITAGADFLVSPGFIKEVAEYAVTNDIFYAPGCLTPSEIISAETSGIKFIKLFPGNMFDPAYLTDIKDIFPNLQFMLTGGVDKTKENIEGWFKVGVSVVGMGSKLISKKLMDAKDYILLEEDTRDLLAKVSSIKNK